MRTNQTKTPAAISTIGIDLGKTMNRSGFVGGSNS